MVRTIVQKVLLSILFLFALSGCEREIPVASSNSSTQGYRIEGFILDGMGKPLSRVPIRLSYFIDFVDTLNRPSRFFVTDTTAIIRVAAYTMENQLLKILFQGRAVKGEFKAGWDETDSLNAPVLNGVYTIQYFIGTTKKYADTVLINSHIVTQTDSIGYYVIPQQLLPMGYFPIPILNSSGKWIGRGEIAPYVRLDLLLNPEHRLYVDVKKDRVTRYDVRI
ncbi:MAG: hypothetical protein V1799_17325 [bacterium]